MKKILKRVGITLGVLIFIAATPWVYGQFRNSFLPGKDLDISELNDEHLTLPPIVKVEDKNNAYFDIEKANRFIVDEDEIQKIYDELLEGKNPENIQDILEKNKKSFEHLNNAFTKTEYFNPNDQTNSQLFKITDTIPTAVKEKRSPFLGTNINKLVYIQTNFYIQNKQYDQTMDLVINFSDLANTKASTQNPTYLDAMDITRMFKENIIKINKLIISNIENFPTEKLKIFNNSLKKNIKSDKFFESWMKHEYNTAKTTILELEREITDGIKKNNFSYKPIKTVSIIKPRFDLLLNRTNICDFDSDKISREFEMHRFNSNQKFMPHQYEKDTIMYKAILYAKLNFIENTAGEVMALITSPSNYTSYFEKKCEIDKEYKEALIELINATKNIE